MIKRTNSAGFTKTLGLSEAAERRIVVVKICSLNPILGKLESTLHILPNTRANLAPSFFFCYYS